MLQVRDPNSGSVIHLPALKGKDGKCAYQYAVEGGFKGTKEEFINLLNNSSTLIINHMADGSAHADIRELVNSLQEDITDSKKYTDTKVSEHIKTSNPHNITLKDLGITTNLEELNNIDKIEDNIQIELDKKANSAHYHAGSYYNKDINDVGVIWGKDSKNYSFIPTNISAAGDSNINLGSSSNPWSRVYTSNIILNGNNLNAVLNDKANSAHYHAGSYYNKDINDVGVSWGKDSNTGNYFFRPDNISAAGDASINLGSSANLWNRIYGKYLGASAIPFTDIFTDSIKIGAAKLTYDSTEGAIVITFD